jgi:hypothetical protein
MQPVALSKFRPNLFMARDADYPTLRRIGIPTRSQQISGRFRARPSILAHCLPNNCVEKWRRQTHPGLSVTQDPTDCPLTPTPTTPDAPSRLKHIARSISDGISSGQQIFAFAYADAPEAMHARCSKKLSNWHSRARL